MKKKIILSSILALGVLGGVVGLAHGPVGVEAVSITAGTKLYLKPNSNWKVDNARFAAYFYGNGDAWVSMTDSDSDGVYEVVSPNKSYSNVIFCRMNPSNLANSWDTKWNQTSDLTWDGTKNLYTVKDGTWDKGGGSWSKYTPPTGYITHSISLAGTLNEWNAETDLFTDDDEDYIFELSKVLFAGEYMFKIVIDNEWLGYDSLTIESDVEVTDVVEDNHNLKISPIEDGEYKFTYDLKSKKLTISFSSYTPKYIKELTNIINPYYNGGNYTRNTTINFNDEALADIATHFHGSVVLKRTTYFTKEALWMTRGTEDSKLSYYGTSGVNMTSGTADAAYELPTTLGTVTKDHKDWDNPEEAGMEGFYITLKDIMENISTAKWSYSNGVYSSKELTDEFLAFTAPCLLDTQNYVQLAGVEIKEDTDGLHLRLLASGTNSGALTVPGVLSEAIITYEA